MSKFERVIVFSLIIFGIIMILKKEKIVNIFEINFNDKKLVSETYIEKDIITKSFENPHTIRIENRAGKIEIEKSNNSKTEVRVKFRIYSKDKKQIKRIENQVKIVFNENKGLKIKTDSINSFPYKSLRIDYYIKTSENNKIYINNEYGNIISKLKSDFFLKNKYGDIIIDKAKRIEYIYNKYGDISVSNSECNKIESKYSKITLENIKSETKIKTKYSKIYIKKAHDLEIKSEFTKINLDEIIGDSEITTSYKRINIKNYKGNLKIKTKFSKIRLNNIIAREFYLINRYEDVDMKNFYTDRAYISLSNANLKLDLLDLKDRLDIKNKYSDISLNIIKNLNPIFIADLKYGNFINNSSLEFNITKKQPYLKILKQEGKQTINIKIDYGNLELSSK